ncbi:hypothetical protein GF1_01220 [Desulfolithobacter dissulfuricans]|uniref:Helicase n=1 Tax=Desulfolithobacter dissulfuricans TaxID=2795293 RepID=A0A915U889_9BACT|nr:DEAD/DEAH box helicase [Desulfolithobacter dissulfuricans]BCO07746.1 hypothetical protein GF1_01220 [Desulfolithobacter dissulfuricans]
MQLQSMSDNRVVLRVISECGLAGAPDVLTRQIKKDLTIKNPKYLAARRYSRWIGRDLKPELYFFREQGDELFFPRGYGNRAVQLCRQLTGQPPEIIDQRRLLEPLELEFSGQLRPYQEQAVQAVIRRSFGVLEAGTGSGKTVMALAVVAARRQPTIILVHSKELLHQWRERIRTFLGLEAGLAGDGRFDPRPVTVAIVNTARRRLPQLTPLFGQLIVDECHRVPASLFTDVVSGFDAHFMLGLSATAFRREDGMTRLIYCYMGDRVHAVDPGVLAASGAVVRPELVQKETGFRSGYRGEYTKLIKGLVADEQRNEQIADDIARLVQDGHQGTVLVVSDRVAHCEILRRKLYRRKVDAALLTGRVPPELRARIVREVQEGQVPVLISTVQLIGEGFDCPGLSTLVLATPIKFEGRLLQVVGRVMRPAEGKKALVIDYVDVKVPVLRRSAEARAEVLSRW